MSLRVIAGSLRSRRLKAPAGSRTRPTGARVREAVFSILADVEAARVLDLFAGSGALGIEALSRGARHATFVEVDRAALACIRANLSELGLEARATVVPLRVGAAATRVAELAPFDLVLCDPPWADLARASTELAALVGAFAPGARVVCEHPRTYELTIAGLVVRDRRVWGDTGVTFLERPSTTPDAEPTLDPVAENG